MTQAPNVYDAESIPAEALAAIEDLMRSGDLFRYTSTSESPVALLEREFAEMMGAKYALAVSSCSSALFLSMRALDLKPGARVLIPAFTFAAVPSAVVHAGCEPVLVDVGDNFRINLADFAEKLPGAGAVIISHMRGHTSDMDLVMQLADAAGIPVIEDAAHSLGTVWNGRKIGTIGKIGCFSFQSYKLVNAGEGGILITDDADIAARATIMSGAYEHNWKKHDGLADACERWQNELPLYNMRLQNVSAAVIRPQLPLVEDRARAGLRNHDQVARALNQSPWLHVPPPLPQETRAPDSLQFLLQDFTDAEALAFQDAAKKRGISVQVFGLSKDNARAFWNWKFIGPQGDLPGTKAMLRKAVDTRLPARLTEGDCDFIARAILSAAAEIKESVSVVAAE